MKRSDIFFWLITSRRASGLSESLVGEYSSVTSIEIFSDCFVILVDVGDFFKICVVSSLVFNEFFVRLCFVGGEIGAGGGSSSVLRLFLSKFSWFSSFSGLCLI